MELTEPMVLPSDVRLVPVTELSAKLRARMGGEASDFALSRPGSRSASKLIDAAAADFLSEFRSPTTVVDAAIRHGNRTGTDPEQVLEEAFSLVMHLVQSRYLVADGSADQTGIEPTLVVGDDLAGTEVLRCVHVTEDTEVYQVRMKDGRTAAAKVLRSGHQGMMTKSLDSEASILRSLNGDPAPKLVAAGAFQHRPYLLTEWCDGPDVSVRATRLRRHGESGSHADLLELAVGICRSYERLHRMSVVHADLNPRNMLLGPDGTVRVLDYGLAISGDHPHQGSIPRGGWFYLYEPETAQNFIQGGRGTAPTQLGEQYALGVLLFQLFTGQWYLDFKASADEMYRQILDEEPRRFEDVGAAAWPEVEKVLRRALTKRPNDRFPSVAHLRRALEGASKSKPRNSITIPHVRLALRREEFIEDLLPTYRLHEDLLHSDELPAPTVSVGYGRAGIAHALHLMSCAKDDPRLLAQADAWSLSAERRATEEGAFINEEIGVTGKLIGEISTLFGPPGSQATKALIAAAMGDRATQASACAGFVRLGSRPSDNLDATLGLSGILLTSAMLVSADGGRTDTTAVINELGDRVFGALWESIDAYPPIGDGGPVKFLGIAHGWAGFLYATLQWCEATGTDLPTNMSTRLRELAACAEPSGLGLRWPSERYPGQERSTRNYMSGWCHGTAGYSILWNLAFRILKDQEFSSLAHRAAIYTWEDSDGYASLCCGLAGRGYALLDHYQSSGDSTWIDRAAILVDRAVDGRSRIPTNMRHSLYKGELGIATLICDLKRPEYARFPFFQPLF